jgi:hypothetical protein
MNLSAESFQTEEIMRPVSPHGLHRRYRALPKLSPAPLSQS